VPRSDRERQRLVRLGKGSTSADMKRGRAEGRHPGRREASPRRKQRRGSGSAKAGTERGCVEVESAEASVSE